MQVNIADISLTAYLANLTLQNGNGQLAFPVSGAGISVPAGYLEPVNVVIANNNSGLAGGGLAVSGQMYCYGCEIENNSTPTDLGGGGVQDSGGGLFITDGAGVWMFYSTLANNTAIRGGGLAGGGYLEMQNSTISSNTAWAGGGGLKTMSTNGSWYIAFTTIAFNSANRNGSGVQGETNLGGGVLHSEGFIENRTEHHRKDTDNRAPSDGETFTPDCATTNSTSHPYQLGAVESARDNLWGVSGGLCWLYDVSFWQTGDLTSLWDIGGSPTSPLDPLLGPLTNHGGYADTHRINTGSPAVDNVVRAMRTATTCSIARPTTRPSSTAVRPGVRHGKRRAGTRPLQHASDNAHEPGTGSPVTWARSPRDEERGSRSSRARLRLARARPFTAAMRSPGDTPPRLRPTPTPLRRRRSLGAAGLCQRSSGSPEG